MANCSLQGTWKSGETNNEDFMGIWSHHQRPKKRIKVSKQSTIKYHQVFIKIEDMVVFTLLSFENWFIIIHDCLLIYQNDGYHQNPILDHHIPDAYPMVLEYMFLHLPQPWPSYVASYSSTMVRIWVFPWNKLKWDVPWLGAYVIFRRWTRSSPLD